MLMLNVVVANSVVVATTGCCACGSLRLLFSPFVPLRAKATGLVLAGSEAVGSGTRGGGTMEATLRG